MSIFTRRAFSSKIVNFFLDIDPDIIVHTTAITDTDYYEQIKKLESELICNSKISSNGFNNPKFYF